MRCALCGKPIENYSPALHRVELHDDREVDICPLCLDSIIKWQQGRLTKLFPTKIAKKFRDNREKNR